MNEVHLICNAHLDPAWLWEWKEGIAEALSTFRVAAELCEQFEGFIFNHNEAVLYEWVEEYEPALFARIRKLVRQGRWHIMGGWYLQPDCNMPSGEGLVRQIMLGREYFRRKFNVAPTTALNLDSFGHARGLVQILRKAGFDSYLFCRPGPADCPLEKETFIWTGYDGCRVMATRVPGSYYSPRGQADEKVRKHLAKWKSLARSACLWGVGNHGGGPSRSDLEKLAQLIKATPGTRLRHSTPEQYFRALRQQADALPERKQDLNAWAVGAYTAQVRIKQQYRRLENELWATEKMAAVAWSGGALPYPAAGLSSATRDMALAQFHDSLPGSSVQPVEEAVLQLLGHGLEELARIKTRTFVALARGQSRARAGEIPILVYNPHPYSVPAIVECEFQLPDQNWENSFTQATVHRHGRALPTQVEKELSNLPLDWRKRVVFAADLLPSQMNRFDARLELLKAKPEPRLAARGHRITFTNEALSVIINCRTGLIDRYRIHGVDYLRAGACRPLVMQDDEDPWMMRGNRFRRQVGQFKLLSPRAGTRFSGLHQGVLPSVRVIEDGPVRSTIEAVFGYSDSFLCQRYKLPRMGTEVEIETLVQWQEKDRMLKLAVPTVFKNGRYRGQTAFAAETLPGDGREVVAQQWVAAVSSAGDAAVTCINEGSYGSDFTRGEFRLSLVRSPAYSAHPIAGRPTLPRDRFTPRMDQGQRSFRFWLNAGPGPGRLAAVGREAAVKNETPMVLSFFPSGRGSTLKPLIELSDRRIQVAAVKKALRGHALVIRLFEPTGRKGATTVALPALGLRRKFALGPFEVKTVRVDLGRRTWVEVDLMEKPWNR